MTDLMRALLWPAHAGMQDRFFGVVVGVVSNNEDPDGMHRVKVRFPWLGGDVESHWARVSTPMAGAGRGVYFLPEVDDEVLVAFEHGSIDHPFVIGSLWNGQDGAPESNSDRSNNMRALHSRSGHIVRLDDSSGAEKIEILGHSGQSKIVIDSSANKISIEASSDITIQSTSGKLTLQANGIEMTSQAGVTIRASQNVDVQATGQMSLQGSIINLN